MPLALNGTTGISGIDGSAATPAAQGSDTNTGVFYPAADTVAIGTNGTERMRVDSSGNVGIGTTTTSDGRLSVSNGGTVRVTLNTDASGAGYIGTSTNHQVQFISNNTPRLAIDTAGNILNISSGGLGYGTGSGGAVTQLTSKSTNVTLNKTNGQVTMNNAALGAGVSAFFSVNNSTVAITDTVVTNVTSTYANYVAIAYFVAAGSFGVRVTNISAGSLSEPVVVNFSVIKAVNA